MTDRDNITPPSDDDEEFTREDVTTLLLEVMDWTYAKAHRNRPMTEAEQKVLNDIRTHLAAETPKHPGYIIGSHWLETAYSRICAGEAEADVLRDCGWERVDDIKALRRDAERYRWLRENARVWPSDKAVWADNQIGAAAIWIKQSVDWTDDASFDAAIDAAMEASTAPASAAADASTAPEAKP